MITAKEAIILSGGDDAKLYPIIDEISKIIESSARQRTNRCTYYHKSHNKDDLYVAILTLLENGFRVELTGNPQNPFETLMTIIW